MGESFAAWFQSLVRSWTDINLDRTGAMLPYYALRQELEKLFARKDQPRARIFGIDDGLGDFDLNAPFELS